MVRVISVWVPIEFKFFFIPEYLFWCGKPKNENYFVEKLFINT